VLSNGDSQRPYIIVGRHPSGERDRTLGARHDSGCLDLAKLVRGTLCAALFRGPTRHVQVSGHIFKPGDAADQLFLIQTGLIKLTAVSSEGEELTIDVFGPGDVFGEMCFRDHVHVHWAIALEPSAITSVNRDELLDRVAERRELLHQFLDLLVGRLGTAHAEAEARAFDTVVQRLGRRLLQIATTSPGQARTFLPRSLRHAELARLLGVKRETVTRAMRQLRSVQVIDAPTRGSVRVHNERLRKR
jgi:CRP/FNR family cyclic AMP-dependent transcriptional regulator